MCNSHKAHLDDEEFSQEDETEGTKDEIISQNLNYILTVDQS